LNIIPSVSTTEKYQTILCKTFYGNKPGVEDTSRNIQCLSAWV